MRTHGLGRKRLRLSMGQGFARGNVMGGATSAAVNMNVRKTLFEMDGRIIAREERVGPAIRIVVGLNPAR